jgi:hypothetical protein
VIFLLIALPVLLFAWYLTFSASRLDRLHHRVETSWEHLDALLQRRAALALEIAHQSGLDPASAFMLTQAAYTSREVDNDSRGDAEISLSESLDFLQNSSESGECLIDASLISELRSLSDKIHISTQVHLEAVSSALKMRARFICKFFRLAGRAKAPVRYSFEERM